MPVTPRKPVIFNAASKPWGSMLYSANNNQNQTIGKLGSAPTIAADIVATLKDSTVNPGTLAQLSMKWGCRSVMNGTYWDFFRKVAKQYRFNKFIETSRWDSLVECLYAGGLAACCVRGGFWARANNYILVYAIDEDSVYGTTAWVKEAKQPIYMFRRDIMRCFCFFPDT